MGTVRSSKVRKLIAVLGNSIKLVCPSMKKLQILRNVDDGTFAQLTGIRLKYLRNTHVCMCADLSHSRTCFARPLYIVRQEDRYPLRLRTLLKHGQNC